MFWKKKEQKPSEKVLVPDVNGVCPPDVDMHSKAGVAYEKLHKCAGDANQVSEAVAMLEQCVAEGDREGMWMMGVCCEHGIGTVKDTDRAEALYKQSFDLGSRTGMFLSKNNGGGERGRAESAYYQLEEEDILPLSAVLQISNWVKLTLNGCRLGKSSFFLAEALMTNTTIKTLLFVSSTKVEDAGAQYLAHVLTTNKSIDRLEINDGDVHLDGVKALSEALKTNNTLTDFLLLGSSKKTGCIGVDGAEAIANALLFNSTLRTLCLDHQQIEWKGARSIADSLKRTPSLTSLSLKSNAIGAKGMTALSDALKGNRVLTSLDLSQNGLESSACKQIMEALAMNQCLTKLVLYSNEIDEKGATFIAEGLKSNSALRDLDLYSNHIMAKGAVALRSALQFNTTLMKLNIKNNRVDFMVMNEMKDEFEKTRPGFEFVTA